MLPNDDGWRGLAPHRHYGRTLRAEHDIRRSSCNKDTASRGAADNSAWQGNLRLPYDGQGGETSHHEYGARMYSRLG